MNQPKNGKPILIISRQIEDNLFIIKFMWYIVQLKIIFTIKIHHTFENKLKYFELYTHLYLLYSNKS